MNVKDKLIAIEAAAARHSTITLHDAGELYVENCTCVKSCDDSFITLCVYGMDITVAGTPLVLESFGVDGVKVTGKIHSLTLEEH